jgi:sarcosine oxidase subunit gamma
MIFSNDIIEKGDNNYELENLLFSNISKNNFGSISDVTDQFVMINLEGKKIFELLSSGCPFNFNEFKKKKGSSTQTILNHTDVIIYHNDSNIVNLFVRRSFSEHLWSWINDAASRL